MNSSSTRLIICDFKNNCDVTRFYDFNSQTFLIKLKSYPFQSKTISSGSQLDYKYLNEPYDYQSEFPSDWILIDLNISRSLQNLSSNFTFPFADFTDSLPASIDTKKRDYESRSKSNFDSWNSSSWYRTQNITIILK